MWSSGGGGTQVGLPAFSPPGTSAWLGKLVTSGQKAVKCTRAFSVLVFIHYNNVYTHLKNVNLARPAESPETRRFPVPLESVVDWGDPSWGLTGWQAPPSHLPLFPYSSPM